MLSGSSFYIIRLFVITKRFKSVQNRIIYHFVRVVSVITEYRIARLIKMLQNRSGTASTLILPRFALADDLQSLRFRRIYKICYFSGFGKFCLKIVKRNVEYTICFFAVINKFVILVVIVFVVVIKTDDCGVFKKAFWYQIILKKISGIYCNRNIHLHCTNKYIVVDFSVLCNQQIIRV